MTLVVQGLTLAPIIRAFRLRAGARAPSRRRASARREASRRGAEALEDLSREPWVDAARRGVAARRAARPDAAAASTTRRSPRGAAGCAREMMRAERRMLVRLRNEGAISDEVLRELEQELDLEAVRVGAGEER